MKTDNEPVAPAALIPLPVDVTWGDGHLLSSDDGSFPEAAVSVRPAEGLDAEGYQLTIDRDGIEIVAGSDAGAFYARQTIDQLIEVEDAHHRERLPFVRIEDSPRFEWRGYMLDVSRHFFDVDVVKQHIDVLSRYKINRLHLHLTDDQGWRIQIDSWPKLTSVGATIDIGGSGPGGFFTKQDYAEIVEYAAERFVTIVPEVDVPGHVNAALASYAELNDDGQSTELTGTVPFGQSALSIEAPGTAKFIQDVFTEIADMTPGEYVHIGGDEAVTLEPVEYAALVQLAVDAVTAAGKTAVGWEEIGSTDLPQSAIVQHWLFPEMAQAAADRGHRVISSPSRRAYLDMKYGDSSPVGQVWAGLVEVDTAYNWDPTDEGLTEDQLLGIEAPLWTETVGTPADVDYLTYPRMLGFAEIGWTPQRRRNWTEYRERLAGHGPRLEGLGVEFYGSPTVDWARGPQSVE